MEQNLPPQIVSLKADFFKLKTIKTQITQEETLPFPLTVSEEFRKRAYHIYYQTYLQRMWAMCVERSSECSIVCVPLSCGLSKYLFTKHSFSSYKLIAFLPIH